MFGLFKASNKSVKSSKLYRSDDEKKLYAIGDIHGRLDLLEKIVDMIEQDANGEAFRFVFLGDYIDRGPQSAQVIDFLLGIQAKHPDTIFLKGNHEITMVDFINDPASTIQWIDWGGGTALESYGVKDPHYRDPLVLGRELKRNLPKEHRVFLQRLKSNWVSGDYVFVHAGLMPNISIDAQSDDHMLWIRDRFFKGGKKSWPDHCIVHGHTPVKEVEDHGWRVNLDTGGVWTGMQAALAIPSNLDHSQDYQPHYALHVKS